VKYSSIVFVALAALAQTSLADCTDVIKLSKGTTSIIQDRESIQTSAAAFCREYKSSSSITKSENYGISYKFLAASMGKFGASANEVASRFCSSSADTDARKDAYRQYVESINDKAYSAYEACERLNAARINFTLTSQLKRDLLIVVGNATLTTATAKIAVATLGGPECRWRDTEGDTVSMVSGASATLKCSRKNTDEESSITLLDLSSGTGNSLTVPWVALDKDGNPVDYLKKLNERVDESVQNLDAAAKSLQGAVVAFNSTFCPSGWREFVPAQGRFIRGIDKTGAGIDPSGLRAPLTLQEDAFKQHQHTLALVGRSGNNAYVNRGPGWGMDDWQGNTTGASTNVVGDSETRPKNVALLYCSRD